ncbi:MAG TPA: arylsulfatase [Chryseosolibacter sp.]|nr:arylsulfatase [Chryseosolibacter sp.]
MKAILACCIICLFAIPTVFAQDPDKPNVVVILTDDQGWGDLSINGNTNLQTPNIDALAKNGARFANFFVSPVCSPTRAEFLTGRYHVRGGVYHTSSGGERLDLDETTIAQVFKSAGYATAAYGKWHNGMQYPYHPNARGFDDFYGFCSGHWGDYFSSQLEHNGELVQGNGFIIDDLTDKALSFLEENKEKPFFLYIPYNTPHSPMQVPDKWWNKFKDKKLDMLSGEAEDVQFTRAALAMCENIDWNVGRVMDKLKSLRLEDNTIVVYFHDNGPNSSRWNGGLKGRKGSTDEGGVKSPLFIRWPGKIEAGKNIHAIAAAIDLLPTLADLTGVDNTSKKPLDGVSLKRLLMENHAPWPERMIFNHWGGSVSLRTQQYRVDGRGKLFDMQADPGQSRDIAGQILPISQTLLMEVQRWKNDVLSELPKVDNRAFTVGDPGAKYTQLPARDAVPHGNIKRSNRFPNSSFLTNWLSAQDSITWNIEVMADGDFEVVLYYTCPEAETGSAFELSFGGGKIAGRIAEGYDPPLRGMENDRVTRTESYVKDFKPLNLGIMHLRKGKGRLVLKALEIPGKQVMDFRLLMFKRVAQ